VLALQNIVKGGGGLWKGRNGLVQVEATARIGSFEKEKRGGGKLRGEGVSEGKVEWCLGGGGS